ncbi:hypothetical protein [Microbacterium sp. ZXX196]|uniref:hypothetical protein n=1 Tax=Microbacterium sp. ZXX196 TaxID=2609291 RepID=UPI0012B79D78|nr:hypothetical protein [Microbacterium sp. ZXX196]MTE24851.1 hypothetical protein [Microbacterium sp. ZXX196]
MAEFTPTTDEIEARWMEGFEGDAGASKADRLERYDQFQRWLAEHDAKVRADALREAHADLQAYTDAGAPFGHRPVEDFLLSRADHIEKEAGL